MPKLFEIVRLPVSESDLPRVEKIYDARKLGQERTPILYVPDSPDKAPAYNEALAIEMQIIFGDK